MIEFSEQKFYVSTQRQWGNDVTIWHEETGHLCSGADVSRQNKLLALDGLLTLMSAPGVVLHFPTGPLTRVRIERVR